VLGKHSGRHALLMRYEELGFPLTKQELQSAYERFTQLADRKKRIYDQDLLSLLTEKPVISNEGSRSTAFMQ
jgi:2-isopropylmalate synthase